MKGWHCLFITLVILVGVTISNAQLLKLTVPEPCPEYFDALFQFKEPGNPTIGVTLSKDGKYIEIKGKLFTLRVYPCGKVEKLEWKELNKNEERSGRFYLMQDNMTRPLDSFSHGVEKMPH